MDYFKYLREEIIKRLEALAEAGKLPSGFDSTKVVVEPPRDPSHGDVSSNVAMVIASQVGMKPRELGGMLAASLEGHEAVAVAKVAGPGFLNMELKASFWHARLREVLTAGTDYGRSDIGAGEKVNVEYVSANPTGPLHIGHGRGAVIGDVLASLLEWVGFDVTREYYVNDSGAQVDDFAKANYRDMRKQRNLPVEQPDSEELYSGEETAACATSISARFSTDELRADFQDSLPEIRRHAVDYMMNRIREDLAALGIRHDVFTSERELVASGAVEEALRTLEARGLIYTGVLEAPKGGAPGDWEPRSQTLFRATEFGDDVDRPLRKSDGGWTYFATDIANHLDKFRRGSRTMINVWGADHGGYVKRMQAAVKAVTDGKGTLDVKLCQMVNLLNRGKPVKMSKRAGTYVALSEVINQVGKDVVRFIMLTRRNDAPLEFDLARVTEQSRENPVFYVQYAHARARSVMRHAGAEFPDMRLTPEALSCAELERLTDRAELALIRMLAGWPQVVENAANAHEPHRLAFYLYDVAAAFHSLWNKGKEDRDLRFIVGGNDRLTAARLALVQGAACVIASGLRIFGVEPVEELR